MKGDTVCLCFSHLPSSGMQHSRQNHHPQNSLLHRPLLPTPAFSPAIKAPLDPYGYRPHHPDSRRRPPHLEVRGSPPHPQGVTWRSPLTLSTTGPDILQRGVFPLSVRETRGRRRGPPPLPRYTPDWDHRTNY